MIDDQDLSSADAFPCLEVEAGFVVEAIAAKAVVAVALHKIPHSMLRFERQVAPAAIVRAPGPAADFQQLVSVGFFTKQAACALLGNPQTAPAEIVGTALD